MASQTALKPESTTAMAKAEATSGLIVEAEKLLGKMKELYQGIEQRAYELFVERGYEIGYDAEDWLRAESECLLKMPVEINEYETTIVARAEMPDFAEKDIHLSIEPRQLLINAKMERSLAEKQDDRLSTEENLKEVFCALALPCEVEAQQAKAIFKGGLLEITLPKLVVNEAQAVEAKME